MRGIKFLYILAVLLVLASLLTDEVEGRRKILKGRKTVTRTYVSESALPAWAWIILIGIGELIAGGIIFLIMKKRVLDVELSGSYTIAGTRPN